MTDGVLLVDVDSTIPNLALMHISTWKKAEGQEIGFSVRDPAEIYASCVFDWNRHKTDGLRFLYPEAKIDIGGGGIDLHKNLPPEVDLLKPDYSIYPTCDYDLGFSTRGCPNKCPFCVVPTKEGQLRRNQHPREFHDPAHKKAVLLDNNILADRAWFFEVTDWLLANHMAVDFNQGLDLRRIDRETAERLAELKPINWWRFAYDSLAVTEGVMRGLDLLKNAGVNLRHQSMIYVYTHDDADFPSALERCERMRQYGILPYPMFNRHAKRTQRMTDLKRWARPWFFFKMDFKTYQEGKTR